MNDTLKTAQRPHHRLEKHEEQLCDNLVCRLTGERESSVVRFSQARATMQTPGISDRRYRVKGRAFWFEVKTSDPKSKLTQAELMFLSNEAMCGELAVCGTVDDLTAFLTTLTEGKTADYASMHAALIRARWIEKGITPTWPARGRRRRP